MDGYGGEYNYKTPLRLSLTGFRQSPPPLRRMKKSKNMKIWRTRAGSRTPIKKNDGLIDNEEHKVLPPSLLCASLHCAETTGLVASHHFFIKHVSVVEVDGDAPVHRRCLPLRLPSEYPRVIRLACSLQIMYYHISSC